MKPKVFVSKKIPAEVEEYLVKNCDLRKWSSEEPIPREVLLTAIEEVDGLLTHGQKINAELLDRAPRLKAVSNMSVGYNNFDLQEMRTRKVVGTNTPGVLDETVADLVFALILASARRICELDKLVKEGKWNKPIGESLYGTDVHHANLGIVGLGRIGEAVARRGKHGFNMQICYHNRRRRIPVEKELGAKYCTLEELLRTADYIVMLIPLTKTKNKMIGTGEFSLMRENAILINASRGETVDEEALISALERGKIRGAALDVYGREPVDKKNPLLAFPNVVTVPHIGSAVKKTRDEMAMLGAENLIRSLRGEKPPNLVPELQDIFSDQKENKN